MTKTETKPPPPPKKSKKAITLWGIFFGFLIIFLVILILWLLIWRFEVTTEDAYVHGNQVVITPQISGYVTSITADEPEIVEQGRVLVELDTIDRELALEEAKNILGNTVRKVAGLFEKAGALKAQREMRRAEFIRVAQDYSHRKKLLPSGGVSKEDYLHSKAAFVSAFANLLLADHELKDALAQIENTTIETHPLVEKTKASLREAYVNLQRCHIRAPVRGMVAMRKVQVGESVNPTDPLMVIVPLEQIWVNANYKEVHLKNVRLDQPVRMKADMWGRSVVFHGKVLGLTGGTGNVFSALPPQNATGNWIKIVQRLPVRISLDPCEIEDHPLRLGLSMHVTIDITDTGGEMLPTPPPQEPLYTTDIFNNQDAGADSLIEEIVKENTQFSFTVGEDSFGKN